MSSSGNVSFDLTVYFGNPFGPTSGARSMNLEIRSRGRRLPLKLLAVNHAMFPYLAAAFLMSSLKASDSSLSPRHESRVMPNKPIAL
jgi:hypothetical protein